jgi:hypothetical protein
VARAEARAAEGGFLFASIKFRRLDKVRALHGATLTAILGIAAAAVAISLHGSRPVPPPSPRNPLVPATPGPTAFGWRLTNAMSAHRALVLEVETTRAEDAMPIARQLTESYQDRFDEVLVYFFEPAARRRLAFLRVQWTRTHGYRVLELHAAR